jgi:hypothetical protein
MIAAAQRVHTVQAHGHAWGETLAALVSPDTGCISSLCVP